MDLLISEELLLIGLDDEKGGTTWLEHWTALHTAVLVDAIAAGAVTVADDRLRPGVEPAHPLLRRVRAAVAEDREPRPVTEWAARIGTVLKPLLASVAAGLVERGVLREERGRALGMFPTLRYPEADPGPERAVRARLRRVLVDGDAPSAHDTLLVALIGSDVGGIDRLLPDDDRAVRRSARARAVAIAENAADQPAIRAAEEAAAFTAALMVTTVIVPTIIINNS